MSTTNSLERHGSSTSCDQETNGMAQFLLGIRNAALCSDTNFDGGAASASLNDSGRGGFAVTLAGDPTAGGIVLFGDGRIGDPLNGIDMQNGAFSKRSYATPASFASISLGEYISFIDDSVNDGSVRFGGKQCGALRHHTLTSSESTSTTDVVLNNEGERPTSWPRGLLCIGASLAVDSASEELVFFGGDMSSDLSVGPRVRGGATSAWLVKLLATSNATPSSRSGTSIACDSASEEFVFFGGDMSSDLSVGARVRDGASSNEVADVNVSRLAGRRPPALLDRDDMLAPDDRTCGKPVQVGGACIISHFSFGGVRIHASSTNALSRVPHVVSSGQPASFDGVAFPTAGVVPLLSVFPGIVGVVVPSLRTGTAARARSTAGTLTAGLANPVTVRSASHPTITGATATDASVTLAVDFGPRFTGAIPFDTVLSATNLERHFSTGEDPVGDITPSLNYSGALCSETAGLTASSGHRHRGNLVDHL
jgi:hypothetical protein